MRDLGATGGENPNDENDNRRFSHAKTAALLREQISHTEKIAQKSCAHAQNVIVNETIAHRRSNGEHENVIAFRKRSPHSLPPWKNILLIFSYAFSKKKHRIHKTV